MNDITKSNTFKRLQEYRIDFANSKNLYFAAAARVKEEEKKQSYRKKSLEIISVIIDVFTLSSIAVYFSKNFEDISIIIIGFLSVISIGINVFLLIYNKNVPYTEYIAIANGYLDLYKKAKNLEAKVNDNLLELSNLSLEVENLHNAQIRLLKLGLMPNDQDYHQAKKVIEEGGSEYSKLDYEKT